MKTLRSLGLVFDGEKLLVLDQSALPHQENWIECRSPDGMIELIQRLAIRGAPLIGVAAALALGAYAESFATESELREAAGKLRAARPTAVNLMAAVDRMVARIGNAAGNAANAADLGREAEAIFDEDVALSAKISERGAALIHDGDSILTHCNTGGLATVGIGTALGSVRRAHEQGKRIHVYADETRPLLQGARLTTWELARLGISHTLICDSMAGFLMSQGKVSKVFVGADRIARNGDVANKIGTYGLAVLARHHRVPFYVVAPFTTVDLQCASGRDIPIEQRPSEEVRAGKSPVSCETWNPAFDVTPRELITAVVLDRDDRACDFPC